MEDPLPQSSNHCDGDETSVFTNLVSPGPEGSASLVGETTDTELTVMTPDKNLTFHTSVCPNISCRVMSQGLLGFCCLM